MDNLFTMEQGSIKTLAFLLGTEYEQQRLKNVSKEDYEILKKNLCSENLQKILCYLKIKDCNED